MIGSKLPRVGSDALFTNEDRRMPGYWTSFLKLMPISINAGQIWLSQHAEFIGSNMNDFMENYWLSGVIHTAINC